MRWCGSVIYFPSHAPKTLRPIRALDCFRATHTLPAQPVSPANRTKAKMNGAIVLRVVGQNGRTFVGLTFRNMPLYRVLRGYCRKFQLQFEDVIFTYDGVPVYEHDTPNMLIMENGDTIQVFTAPPVRA